MAVTGLVSGLPLMDYVRDPAPAPSLSASLAHTLLTRSPHHAWYESPRLNPGWQPEHDEQLDIGTIVHAIVLEGDRSRIVVVDAPDWRTNAAKAARAEAWKAGKLPILMGKMEAAQEVALAVQAAIAKSELAEVFKPGQGEPEVTLIWQEDEIWCRARPDWSSKDRRVLMDLKTTGGNAERNAWARGPLVSLGFDLQAAHAMRGMAAIAKPKDVTFVFVVAETEPPYGVSFVSLDPAFVAFAEAKLATARGIWRDCVRDNHWPSYPTRIAYAEPPAWLTSQWEERQVVTVDDGRPLAEQLFGSGQAR